MPNLVGWLVLQFVFVAVQQWFYEIHRRHHQAWRSGIGRWLVPRSDELRAMVRATFLYDPVPEVERARRIYLLVLGLMVAYLVASFFIA